MLLRVRNSAHCGLVFMFTIRTLSPLRTLLVLLLAPMSLTGAEKEKPKELPKAELAKVGKEATALIEVGRRYFGSAFCVHPSGLFVTNNHVVSEGTDEVKLTLNTGLPDQERYQAKVIRRDEKTDLALLSVSADEPFPTLNLGDDSELHELTEVICFGYPFGKGLAVKEGEFPAVSVNIGAISSLRRQEGKLFRLQLDTGVNPGNSGGPLVDLTGSVVGVVVGRVEANVGAGLDLAIPVSHLRSFLRQPDISFDPPVAADPGEIVKFSARARVIPLPEKPATLELIIKRGGDEPRAIPMKYADGVYTVEAAPFPGDDSPTLIPVEVEFADGAVKGIVKDQSFQVGDQESKLSQVEHLKIGEKAELKLNDRRTFEGELAGMKELSLSVGGQTVNLKLEKATGIRVNSDAAGATTTCTVVAKLEGDEIGRANAVVYLQGRARPSMEAIKEGKFIRPARCAVPVTYLKFESSKGDYIGQGRNYSYRNQEVVFSRNSSVAEVSAGGWNLRFAGPNRTPVTVGEHLNAIRYPFNKEVPGISISGHGRGCNQIAGKFVVWELEEVDGKLVRLAVDFLQRCEGRGPPLYGMLRVNSTYH